MPPSSASVRRFLEASFRDAGEIPRDLISDQGIQFTARGFRRWCHHHGFRHRFGALGKYGSLAVIERGIRTIKNECTRLLSVVPFRLAVLEQELALYFSWYNGLRPHIRLGGATPDEVYHRRRPAIRAPRFEPRPRWPRRSPCASPRTLIRGQPGVRLDLHSIPGWPATPTSHHVEARRIEIPGCVTSGLTKLPVCPIRSAVCCRLLPGLRRRFQKILFPNHRFSSTGARPNGPHDFGGPLQSPGGNNAEAMVEWQLELHGRTTGVKDWKVALPSGVPARYMGRRCHRPRVRPNSKGMCPIPAICQDGS
jgi:hypothetical protein